MQRATASDKDCLDRNRWNALLEARVVIGDFGREHNPREAGTEPYTVWMLAEGFAFEKSPRAVVADRQDHQ
jgi:hypothetical protein